MKKILISLGTVLILILNCVSAFADEVQTLPQLTVEEATGYAIANSSELKKISENKVVNADTADQLRDKMAEASESSTILNLAVQMMQLDIKSATNSSDEQTKKEILEYSITSFFSSIINAEKELELYDRNTELLKKELEWSRLKFNLGVIGQKELDTEKKNYNKTLSDRITKDIAISKAYISLNELMGKKLDNRYRLQLEYKYQPLVGVTVEGAIANATAESTEVKSLEGALNVAQYQLDSYSSDNTSSEETVAIAVTQASRALLDEKESIQESIITAYYGIQEIETAYQSNTLELAEMKKQLIIKEKQYELGKITELDLEKYKYEIAVMEETIRKQIFNHELKVIQFKNPNLL